MPPLPPRYVQISGLPLEEQEAAVAYLERTYGKQGPITVPDAKPRAGLWCGHLPESVRKDESGVEYCAECSK